MALDFDDDDDFSIDDILGEFDDGPPRPPAGPLSDEAKKRIDEYWAAEQAADRAADEEARHRKRGRNKNFGGDSVNQTRMTQTEVALRLARGLIESPLIRGPNIYLQLGGAELRRGADSLNFPVKTFLARWGFAKEPNNEKYRDHWIGFYVHGRTGRKLLLNQDKFDGHIMAFFATGERLIVHCSGGNVGNTRSPAERHDLHRAIGRAVSWPEGKPEDIVAVCTPRSERFRRLTGDRAGSAGVQKQGLLFFHVDRGGGVMGLPGQQS